MKRVLITGGSEGIGLELAKCFAGDGYSIVLNGRNEEKLSAAKKMLEETYHIPAEVIPMDLSSVGSAAKLYALAGDVDVLVNNAGCGYAGRTWQLDVEKEEAMAVVNDVSLMTLSRLFLRDHIQKKDGILLNVSSTGAFQPGPYIASYYASKSFVLSYTRAIAQEVREYGVHVHCLCPGPVHTSFYEKSGGHHPSSAMRAEDVAVYAYRRLGKRKVVIVPGFSNRLMRILPEMLKMHAVGAMKKRHMK